MSNSLQMIDRGSEDFEYFWHELERQLAPSSELVALADTYGGLATFDFYSAPIRGRQRDVEWVTLSWIEVAYSPTSRIGLIVWNSGVQAGPRLEIPERSTAGWPDCDSPEEVLRRQQEKLREDGMLPIIGVTNCFDGVMWRPRILGYEA